MVPNKESHHDSHKDRGLELPRFARSGEEAAVAIPRMLESFPLPVAILRARDQAILFTNRLLTDVLECSESRLLQGDSSLLFPKLKERRRLRRQLDEKGCIRGQKVEGRRWGGKPVWFSVWQERIICGDSECLLTVLLDITSESLRLTAEEERCASLQSLLDLSDHDRQVIAYEIHDGVSQYFSGALMQVDAAIGRARSNRPVDVDQLETIANVLRDGIRETRRLIDGVRLPELEIAGLIGALNTLIEQLRASSSIEVSFIVDVDFSRLPSADEMAIYRMVQESLTNVARHSESSIARVHFRQADERLTIVVADEGIGFDPGSVDQKKHFGLVGMRQRARLMGGTFRIDSVINHGTTIRIELPIRRPARS